MFHLKNIDELLLILFNELKVGTNLLSLEEIVIKFCDKYNVSSTFKGYNRFPCPICVSINDEVLHGFVRDLEVVEGDIISIDCGLDLNGFYSDSAFTKVVGLDDTYIKLVNCTEHALYEGISSAKSGNRFYDISSSIYSVAEDNGFNVVKEFCGHGTGFKLHEFPPVPNHITKGVNWLLKPGMVIAIEPIFIDGSDKLVYSDNGFTIKSAYGCMSAHFEHTVAIMENGPLILSKI